MSCYNYRWEKINRTFQEKMDNLHECGVKKFKVVVSVDDISHNGYCSDDDKEITSTKNDVKEELVMEYTKQLALDIYQKFRDYEEYREEHCICCNLGRHPKICSVDETM